MGVWDISTPTGTDPRSQGDDRIRELKAALQEALQGGFGTDEGDEAVFPGSEPAIYPVFRYRGRKGTTIGQPVAGQNGLYFDSDRNSLQRDNGSTWDDIGTNFPAGTKTVFCDPTVPVGWTKDVTQNGKALRVTSGDGGGTGGSQDPATSISLAHSHIVNSHSHPHTHSTPAHSHNLAVNPGTFLTQGGGSYYYTTEVSGGGVTGSSAVETAPGTDSKLTEISLAYTNVLIGIKD